MFDLHYTCETRFQWLSVISKIQLLGGKITLTLSLSKTIKPIVMLTS